ncbi:hypothetical protein [Streptomyces sp. NPDC018031]|uniref:hypothetical protein n=1 Tax=Streptomyces sp. NPDC018031 TaxID=3365033 RepID=UPI0037B7088E
MGRRSVAVRTGAVGAVVALGAALGAPLAVADGEPTRSWAEIDAPAQINVAGGATIKPYVGYSFSDGGATFPLPRNAKLVIDATGLKGIATIKANNEQCTTSGAVVTCLDNGNLHGPWEPITLTAEAGAELGARGTLGYQVTADEATGDEASSTVVIGEPKVVAGKLPDRDGLKTGDTVELPVAVRNDGDLVTERVDVRLTGAPGLRFADRPKNCRFDVEWDGSEIAWCAVEAAVEPGKAARLSRPLTAEVTGKALAPWIDYTVEAVPVDAHRDPNGTPGTGAPVGLTPVTGGEFADGGESSVSFGTGNHADFRARGGVIKTVKNVPTQGGLAFGLENDGPAAAYRRDGKPLLYADITLPEGVTAVSNHIDEEPDQDTTGACLTHLGEGRTKPFEGGHRRYLCPEAPTELPGEGQTYGLEVKIAKDADRTAKGVVRLVPGPDGFDVHDPNPANDTAVITFDGAPGGDTGGDTGGGTDGGGSGDDGSSGGNGGNGGSGSSGSAGGSDSAGSAGTATGGAGDSGSGSSGGGSMALTGAGGIGLIAGGAAVAVALGAGAVVVTRRRAAAADTGS